MSRTEIDNFLSKPLVARVATIRDDGYPHVTPLWYHWDGEHLYLILGQGERPRRHIANLRQNDKVTLFIDRDVRPETKSLFEAQAVSIRGRAKLLTDEKAQVDIVSKLLKRYGLGGAVSGVHGDGNLAK